MTYDEQIQEALQVTDIQEEETVENVITLSTGVVIKRKPFPLMRIQAVTDRFPNPEPKKIYNKSKDRWEDWTGSKEYNDAMQEVNNRRGMAVVDTIIAAGTECIHIPEGFPTPDSDEWIEELEIGHIKVKAESKIARYHAWVKYVAAVTEEDLVKIMTFANNLTGKSEGNVAEQLQANFQDN